MRATLPIYNADQDALRRTFSYFPSGVVALLAQVDGQPIGMVATAFSVGVSYDPPMVSCSVQNKSSTWPLLRQSPRIGVSVFREDQAHLCRQIASRDRAKRFAGVPLRDTGSDALFIGGAPVWFECTIAGQYPAGDHTLALLQVHALGADEDVAPLVAHGAEFRRLTEQGSVG
jgi:flavin reductase (DIM6/NTAB) family NADH-FMN oxidoreductase RutF